MTETNFTKNESKMSLESHSVRYQYIAKTSGFVLEMTILGTQKFQIKKFIRNCTHTHVRKLEYSQMSMVLLDLRKKEQSVRFLIMIND